MNFSGNSNVKLGNIKTYNTATLKNNAFKNQFYSDVEEIDYNKYDATAIDVDVDLDKSIERAQENVAKREWYEYVKDVAATAVCSFSFGVLEVVENIGDGLIMAGGAIASSVVSPFNEALAQDIKDGTSSAVKYDWTEAGYNATMNALDVDDKIAHGNLHKYASMAGTTAGYIALSMIPGGAAVTATTGALSAAGSASEVALNSGASFEEAAICGAGAGVFGGISGGALNKIKGAAGGATSLLGATGYTAAGVGVAAFEPIANSATQYLAYGKDMVDENGNKIYANVFDYYKGSGGLLNTGIAAFVGGSSTGINAVKGYKNYSNLIKSEQFSNYENKVLAKMKDDTIYDYAKKSGLSKSEIELSAEELDEITSRANKKSISNAQKIHKVSAKAGVDTKQVFELLSNGEEQATVFPKSFIKKYYDSFNFDKNGNAEVVTFKNGSNYDRFVNQQNAIGFPDGEFVMPKSEYDKIVKKCFKNGVFDTDLLEKELQLPDGSFSSGVVAVTQTIKVQDLSLPKSSLQGAMLGEWIPGGKTGGGVIEGIVCHMDSADNGKTWHTSTGNERKISIKDFRN